MTINLADVPDLTDFEFRKTLLATDDIFVSGATEVEKCRNSTGRERHLAASGEALNLLAQTMPVKDKNNYFEAKQLFNGVFSKRDWLQLSFFKLSWQSCLIFLQVVITL